MSLNSFGAILSFAEELETQKQTFYRTAIQKAIPAAAAALFESLAIESEKQVKLIQRTRRENVTEMILEPVNDFYRQSFAMEFNLSDDPEKVVRTAIKNEEICLTFYSEASLKLKMLAEVSRTLKQLAKKQTARIEKFNRL